MQVRLHSNNRKYDTENYRSDFNRLARILTDSAVGLVLGGGGARGISHLGVLQALEERGIAIDMVGGTSIGSFIGGLVACEQYCARVDPIAKSWSAKLASLWFYFEGEFWANDQYVGILTMFSDLCRSHLSGHLLLQRL